MVFSPAADHRFQPGEVVIVLGKTDDISRFRDAFEL
jgi:K+/H+ antiporter YhaU regulatory subunit KhtT